MTQRNLNELLDHLLVHWEDEVVEFKQGGAGYSTHDIGKYFSALSNEANLRGLPFGWLVFGVEDAAKKVVGSGFDVSPGRLNRSGGLKQSISQGTDPAMCFADIQTLEHSNGRVVFFQIPAAPKGIPIAWNGHYYARSGENLMALGLEKLDAIRRQGRDDDWSAVPVEGATLDDLDESALEKARSGFAEKNALKFSREEVRSWSLPAFLDRARLTRNGIITRTTLLLVGKELSAHLLSPHPAQLVWKLVGEEQANEIFRPPFLLATNALFKRIRNVQIKILPIGELIPREVPKYVPESILEALHNCIAHQDYGKNGRVVVTEHVDRVVFENVGRFFEGRPEDYISGDKTPARYRNWQLVEAMREINMIDTQGYGIHRLYEEQRKRYFPMPDYEVSSDSVKMAIYGHVVDQAYSSLLIRRGDLSLDDVCLLDRVQKKLPIDSRAASHLRREGLIEGRVPRLHISAKIAATGDQEDSYLAAKGFDDLFYMHRVLQYLCMKGHAPREKIEGLLKKHLSTTLTEAQKKNKIGNLLSVSMDKQRGWIKNDGGRGHSSWTLTEKGVLECRRENAECRRRCPRPTQGGRKSKKGC